MDYEHERQLDDAIKNNDLELFKRLLAEQPDNDKYLPLEDTCLHNRLEMAKVLIKKGAYIHDGFNSLAYAAEHGNIEFIKYLYEYAEHIGNPYNGPSIAQALESVASSGNTKAMEFILSLYDRSKVTPGYDPIDGGAVEAAIQSKDLAMLKALIDNGADPILRGNKSISDTKKLIHKYRHDRKFKSILTYLLNVKKEWPIYKAIFENDIAEIDRIFGKQPLSLSKDTKAWLKHGCTKTPGFEHAQRTYRLGIIRDRLERKMTRPVAKVRPNKI